jgi:hypothetical protein
MQHSLALLAASFLMLPATSVLAGEIDYTIISGSSMTLTLLNGTTAISSGQSTSLTGNTATTKLTGTLGATISGGGITFNGDTPIDANLQQSTAAGNPLLQLHPSTGGVGSAPADVGLNFKTTLIIFPATGSATVSNDVNSLTGGGALSGGTSGTFLANTTSLTLNTADIDYTISSSVITTAGSTSLTNELVKNGATGDGTVTVSGLTTTITMPISALITGLISTDGVVLNIRIVGTIVAQSIQAAVPEPGTLTLMGIASLGGLGWMGWARRRRASK